MKKNFKKKSNKCTIFSSWSWYIFVAAPANLCVFLKEEYNTFFGFPRQTKKEKIFKFFFFLNKNLVSLSVFVMFNKKNKKIKKWNKKIKEYVITFCLVTLTWKTTDREESTRLYASVRFNEIRCSLLFPS